MKFLKTLPIFLLISMTVVMATGCGKKTSKHSSEASEVSEVRGFASLAELQEFYKAQAVSCSDKFDCPGYSAKLAFWGKSGKVYSLGVCSGTLYKNRYIITNSHCIPVQLKNGGGNCSEQLKALFPETAIYSKESAKCQRIVQSYDQDSNQPDIAVIELDRDIYRDEVEIEKSAFIEDSNVYAHTMNPMTGKMGVITKKTCQLSTDNTFYMTVDKNAPAALLSGYNCMIIGGNSGSGLMKDGKLIGAIYARIDKSAVEEHFKRYKVNYSSSMPIGVAQNIGCVSSIYSKGINCRIKDPTSRDLDEYIQRSMIKFGLRGQLESQLNYVVGDVMKLNISQPLNRVSNPLSEFRQNWMKAILGQQAKSSTNAGFLEAR